MKNLQVLIILFLVPLVFAQDDSTRDNSDGTTDDEIYKNDPGDNTDGTHDDSQDSANEATEETEEDTSTDEVVEEYPYFENPNDNEKHEYYDECEGLPDEECKKLFDEDPDKSDELHDDSRPGECEGLSEEECKKLFMKRDFDESYKDEIYEEEIKIPEGCHLEKSEFGKFVICEKEEDFELDNLESKCREHSGKFHLGEFGPECIFEQKTGFFQETQCHENSFLEEDARRCQADGGKPEKFIDDSGCTFVSCNYENFEKKREEKFRNIEDQKERFFKECESKNGRPTILKGKPHCFTPKEKVRIREELKTLEPTDLLKIALKIENIIKSLISVQDNFEELRKFYEDRGNDKKVAIFERSISKIEGAKDRLDEIRNDIADKAGDIKQEDRINILRDIQHVKNMMQNIALEVLTGKPSDREERDYDRDEEGFMEKIRHCEDFTQSNPYSFDPEPEFNVKIYIDDEKCVMNINSDRTGEVSFLIPPKIYQFFRGPEQLFNSDVDCFPSENCDRMQQMFREEDDGDDDRDYRDEPRADPRPKHCEDNNLSNKECYEWRVNNVGTPSFCRDISEETCKEMVLRSWNRDLRERGEI
jgi:hypothetical protein